jgi:hypothetical protein
MTISPRLLFLSFLGLGLVTGLFLGTLSQALAASVSDPNQHNTLFVLVDDFSSSNPVLEGIWLAARQEGSDQWNWMPIYPAPLEEEDSEYAKPHSAFYLPSKEIPDVNSLPPLRAQRVWWNEVFWLDEAALGLLQTISGKEPVAMVDTWLEPQAALFGQVQILNNLCKAGQVTASGAGTLDQLLALMPSHIRLSINSFDLITRWDGWSQDGFPLSCTHPWAD